MSFFSDIFNPTFLMFLGILTIVLGLIIIYFESKLREQNHKISSMLSLVSSLAEEINNVKIGLNNLTIMSAGGNSFPFRQNINNVNILEKIDEEDDTMINVSDDDEDDEDEDDDINDEDDDEDEDNDNDNDDDDDDDDDDDVKTVINKEMNDVKILKINMNEEEENREEDNDFEEINDLDFHNENEDNECDEELNELEIVSDTESDSESGTESDNKNKNNSGKSFILFNKQNNNDNNDFVPIDAIKEINNENLKELSDDHFDLKSINISNLEESKNNDVDYKKMSLTKLKSMVSEKGLSKDPSKLKKHELIKLLELELE
jgi:hypothetical protein